MMLKLFIILFFVAINFNPFTTEARFYVMNAGVDFGRQILTFYIKPVPALERLITPSTHSVWNTNINIININNAKGPL